MRIPFINGMLYLKEKKRQTNTMPLSVSKHSCITTRICVCIYIHNYNTLCIDNNNNNNNNNINNSHLIK